MNKIKMKDTKGEARSLFSFPIRLFLKNSIKDSTLPGRVQYPEFRGSHCWFDKGLRVPFRKA